MSNFMDFSSNPFGPAGATTSHRNDAGRRSPASSVLSCDETASGIIFDDGPTTLLPPQHEQQHDDVSHEDSNRLLAAMLHQHNGNSIAKGASSSSQQQRQQQQPLFTDLTNQQQQQQVSHQTPKRQQKQHNKDTNDSSRGSNDESPSVRIVKGVLDTIEDTPEGKRAAMAQAARNAQVNQNHHHHAGGGGGGVCVPAIPLASAQHQHLQHQQHQQHQQQHLQPLQDRERNNVGDFYRQQPPPLPSSASSVRSSQQFVVSATPSQCSTNPTSRSNSPPQPYLAPPPGPNNNNIINGAPFLGGRPAGGSPTNATAAANGIPYTQFNANPNSSRFPHSRAVNGAASPPVSGFQSQQQQQQPPPPPQQFARGNPPQSAGGAYNSNNNTASPRQQNFQQFGNQMSFPHHNHAYGGNNNSNNNTMHEFSLQLVIEFKLERRIRVRATEQLRQAQGSYVVVDLDHGLGQDCGVCIGVFPYALRHTIPREWGAGNQASGRAVRLANAADCERINTDLPALEARAIEKAHSLVKFLHFPFDVIDAEIQFDQSVIKIFYEVQQQAQAVTVPNLSRIQRELCYHVGVRRVFFEQLVDLDDPDVAPKKPPRGSGANSSADNSQTDISNNSSGDKLAIPAPQHGAGADAWQTYQ